MGLDLSLPLHSPYRALVTILSRSGALLRCGRTPRPAFALRLQAAFWCSIVG
jgi:hypothetical protein